MATCQVPFQARQPLCYAVPAESFIWSASSSWLIQPQTEVALWEITSYVYLLYGIITSGLIASANHIKKEQSLISQSHNSLSHKACPPYLEQCGTLDFEVGDPDADLFLLVFLFVCFLLDWLVDFLAVLLLCDFEQFNLLLQFCFLIRKAPKELHESLRYFPVWGPCFI